MNSAFINNIITESIKISNYKNFVNKINDKFMFNIEKICFNDDEIFYFNVNKIRRQDIQIDDIINDYIFNKNPFKIITEFPKYQCLSNISLDVIQNSWDKIKIFENFSGDDHIILNHNDKWYDFCNNDSNCDENKIKTDILNKNYIYFFTTNYNSYNLFDSYKHQQNIVLKFIVDKQSGKITNKTFSNMHNKTKQVYFDTYDDMLKKLNKISVENIISKKITVTGYNIIFDDNYYDNYFIYTNIFDIIVKELSKWNNKYQLYLDLYKKNKLADYLLYFTKYSNETTLRINISIKTISKEILNIYHSTRKNNNIYRLLSETYKKILFDIHGLYINNKKSNINESIKVNDVYFYIKEQLETKELIQLYQDRKILLDTNEFSEFLDDECLYSIVQTELLILNSI